MDGWSVANLCGMKSPYSKNYDHEMGPREPGFEIVFGPYLVFWPSVFKVGSQNVACSQQSPSDLNGTTLLNTYWVPVISLFSVLFNNPLEHFTCRFHVSNGCGAYGCRVNSAVVNSERIRPFQPHKKSSRSFPKTSCQQTKSVRFQRRVSLGSL